MLAFAEHEHEPELVYEPADAVAFEIAAVVAAVASVVVVVVAGVLVVAGAVAAGVAVLVAAVSVTAFFAVYLQPRSRAPLDSHPSATTRSLSS